MSINISVTYVGRIATITIPPHNKAIKIELPREVIENAIVRVVEV